MDNIAQQADEIEVLRSIYGASLCCEGIDGALSINVSGSGQYDFVHVSLILCLPSDYPSDGPPSFQISSPHLNAQQKDQLTEILQNIYLENPGAPIIYQWVEALRSNIDDVCASTNLDDSLNSSFQSEDIQSAQSDFDFVDDQATVSCPTISTGGTINDRKSAFQAHCAKLDCVEQVGVVLESLKSCGKVARATHNIVAWKIGVHQDCEDDGEHGAGSRLLHLLQLLGADNLIVVVSRWYGGIHLGPDRFKHICNVARDVIISNGLATKVQPQTSSSPVKTDKKLNKRYRR